MERPEPFVGVAPHPYAAKASPGWPAAVLTPGSGIARQPGSLSGWSEMSDTTKLLVVVGVGLLLFFILSGKFGGLVKKNPAGPNRIVKVYKTTSGWWFKLTRKKAKRHGPYASEEEAAAAAESKGYAIFEE
jgi:hypothetical protein